MEGTKIAIIGAGNVGATIAYTLLWNGLASELVLVDVDRDRAVGEAMDLSHGVSLLRPVTVRAGEYQDCAGAAIVVITAGAAQQPGETRLDLTRKNARILREIIPPLLQYCRESILLVVSNPVDVLTELALRLSGLPPDRVIGSGTVLDSSRFRHLLGRHCGVDPRNVHAYVVGEHGDSEVPVWSLATVGGLPVAEFCRSLGLACPAGWQEEISRAVRTAAYEVIERKGATYYAVSVAVSRITDCILRDERSLLTVSTRVQLPGLPPLCLSLPTLLGRSGVEYVLRPPLAPEEEEGLLFSARRLLEAQQGI